MPRAHVHAVTSIENGVVRSYDANGNAAYLYDPAPGSRALKIEWTTDDRPASVVDTLSGRTVSFLYDHAGERVRTNDSLGATYFIGKYVEIAHGGVVKYYYAGDKRVAKRDSTGVTFYHEDHRNSVVLQTDAMGLVVGSNDYEPYGARSGATQIGGGADGWTFGGGWQQVDLGIVHMGARVYDPRAGQFISADSIIPDVYDPQSLNRYSYVQNDPINFWDPTGHIPFRVELRKEQAERSTFRSDPYGGFCIFGAVSCFDWSDPLASSNMQAEFLLQTYTGRRARSRYGIRSQQRRMLSPPQGPLQPRLRMLRKWSLGWGDPSNLIIGDRHSELLRPIYRQHLLLILLKVPKLFFRLFSRYVLVADVRLLRCRDLDRCHGHCCDSGERHI